LRGLVAKERVGVREWLLLHRQQWFIMGKVVDGLGGKWTLGV
jgi:hypothetical protein